MLTSHHVPLSETGNEACKYSRMRTFVKKKNGRRSSKLGSRLQRLNVDVVGDFDSFVSVQHL